MPLAYSDGKTTIYDKDIIIDCDSGEVGVVFMTIWIVLESSNRYNRGVVV